MIGTIIISSLIAITVLYIIIKGIIDKKNGKSSCSCGCQGCALKDTCHKR